MSRNICGNCANFKPGKGQRFFNCTYAKHAGTSYGMQVRADTASCDAFKPIQTEKAPAPSKQTPSKQALARKNPPGLCPWGRLILIVAIILILALLSWAAYTCASKSTKLSHTPTPTPTSTGSPTPTPTPASAFLIIGNYTVGQWAQIPGEFFSILSASRTYEVPGSIGNKPAPPGLVFIMISVSVSSNGDFSLPFAVGHFLLGDTTGVRWQPSDWSGISLNASIPAGSSQHAYLFFLVPDIPYSGLNVYWELMGDPMKWTVWKLPF